MSVHSNHYDSEEEYLRDLKAEYNRPEYHEDIPFYTDDADDPHFRCNNCRFCKEIEIMARVIRRVSWIDENGYVHNNPKEPETLKPVIFNDPENYLPACLCLKTNKEIYEDDFCEEFEEVENEVN